MEINEIPEQIESPPALVLTIDAQKYLRESGKWAYFLGATGFLGTAVMLIIALYVSSILSFITKTQPAAIFFDSSFVKTFSYTFILIAIFYFFFSLYLFQFGSKIKKGIKLTDPGKVSAALRKLKSFFRLWGITTIITIGFYLIIIIGVAAIIGASAAFHK